MHCNHILFCPISQFSHFLNPYWVVSLLQVLLKLCYMMKTFLFLSNLLIASRSIRAQGEQLELGQILPMNVLPNNPPISASTKYGTDSFLPQSATELVLNPSVEEMQEGSGLQRRLSHKSSKSSKTESPTFFPTASPTMSKSSKSSRRRQLSHKSSKTESPTFFPTASPTMSKSSKSSRRRQLSHKSSKTESPTFFPTTSPTVGKSSKSSRWAGGRCWDWSSASI